MNVVFKPIIVQNAVGLLMLSVIVSELQSNVEDPAAAIKTKKAGQKFNFKSNNDKCKTA